MSMVDAFMPSNQKENSCFCCKTAEKEVRKCPQEVVNQKCSCQPFSPSHPPPSPPSPPSSFFFFEKKKTDLSWHRHRRWVSHAQRGQADDHRNVLHLRSSRASSGRRSKQGEAVILECRCSKGCCAQRVEESCNNLFFHKHSNYILVRPFPFATASPDVDEPLLWRGRHHSSSGGRRRFYW